MYAHGVFCISDNWNPERIVWISRHDLGTCWLIAENLSIDYGYLRIDGEF